MTEITNLGVIEDPRSAEAKAKDFQHKELAGAVLINWVVKDPSIWKKYSMRNQNGASDCVGNGCAKAFETQSGIVESAHPIYRSRSNYPGLGMWLQDAGDIGIKIGTATEQADPSNNTTEAQMDLPITVPLTVKARMYVMVDVSNIDNIAEAIEIAKSCPIIINGSLSEWTNVPVYNPNGKIDLSHCVCAVDYFMYNGEKAILIDDSWGHATTIGNGGQRVLTESYLKARCTGAMYFLNLGPTNQKPKYTFSKHLTYGMMNDPDVKALQTILAYEALFPSTLETGNYLNITATAVLKWQIAHNVASLEELNGLQGKLCGPKTIAMLNLLYGS